MIDDLDFPDVDEPAPDITGRNDAGATQLIPPAFLRRLVAVMSAHGPLPHRTLYCQARGGLAKFWYGDDTSVHYEVWVHQRTQQLELGLHFESNPEYNRALYR